MTPCWAGNAAVRPQLSVIRRGVRRDELERPHRFAAWPARSTSRTRPRHGRPPRSRSPSLDGLRFLRTVATKTKLPALVVVQEYTNVINDVLALNDQIAQAASDPSLAQTVHVLGLVSAMQEVASEQRAILAAALLQGSFGAGQQSALQAAQSAQQSDLASFNISASVSQQQIWNNSVNKLVRLPGQRRGTPGDLAAGQRSLAGERSDQPGRLVRGHVEHRRHPDGLGRAPAD